MTSYFESCLKTLHDRTRVAELKQTWTAPRDLGEIGCPAVARCAPLTAICRVSSLTRNNKGSLALAITTHAIIKFKLKLDHDAVHNISIVFPLVSLILFEYNQINLLQPQHD